MSWTRDKRTLGSKTYFAFVGLIKASRVFEIRNKTRVIYVKLG